jgi:hypothetical protein
MTGGRLSPGEAPRTSGQPTAREAISLGSEQLSRAPNNGSVPSLPLQSQTANLGGGHGQAVAQESSLRAAPLHQTLDIAPKSTNAPPSPPQPAPEQSLSPTALASNVGGFQTTGSAQTGSVQSRPGDQIRLGADHLREFNSYYQKRHRLPEGESPVGLQDNPRDGTQTVTVNGKGFTYRNCGDNKHLCDWLDVNGPREDLPPDFVAGKKKAEKQLDSLYKTHHGVKRGLYGQRTIQLSIDRNGVWTAEVIDEYKDKSFKFKRGTVEEARLFDWLKASPFGKKNLDTEEVLRNKSKNFNDDYVELHQAKYPELHKRKTSPVEIVHSWADGTQILKIGDCEFKHNVGCGTVR